jgi:Superfamily I DNA and RNA helicases
MQRNPGLEGKALNIAGTNESPLRVIVGSGTGKSFALKRRVGSLLEEGVDPCKMLTVSFTGTAASNLVEDLSNLGVNGCNSIRAGILHAYCFSL